MQSLAADTRLHTLFDETRHEGKNEMEYMASGSEPRSYTAPSPEALDASDSDMSLSDDENGDEGHIHQGEVKVPCGDSDDDGMEEDDNTSSVDENQPRGEEDELGIGLVNPNDSDDESEEGMYIYEDDNETNLEAYIIPNSSAELPRKTEQGGVLHLVHGWIQQNQPEKVSTSGSFVWLC